MRPRGAGVLQQSNYWCRRRRRKRSRGCISSSRRRRIGRRSLNNWAISRLFLIPTHLGTHRIRELELLNLVRFDCGSLPSSGAEERRVFPLLIWEIAITAGRASILNRNPEIEPSVSGWSRRGYWKCLRSLQWWPLWLVQANTRIFIALWHSSGQRALAREGLWGSNCEVLGVKQIKVGSTRRWD